MRAAAPIRLLVLNKYWKDLPTKTEKLTRWEVC